MVVESLNIGKPKKYIWKGREVSTAIFKMPYEGVLNLKSLNLDGDKQADLRVHGGPDKAVYGYAAEYYTLWKNENPEYDFPFGAFGENLTIEGGLFEDNIFVGDIFSCGTAELMAVQPRMPCYKLGLRFGNDDMISLFLNARRTGVYFKVLREGKVSKGVEMKKIVSANNAVSISELFTLLTRGKKDIELIKKARATPHLPESLTAYFQKY